MRLAAHRRLGGGELRRNLTPAFRPGALAMLGWNERVASAAAAPVAAHPDAILARVTRTDRGLVSVITGDGPIIATAGPEPAATGDWVLLETDGDALVVVAVVPRFSAF